MAHFLDVIFTKYPDRLIGILVLSSMALVPTATLGAIFFELGLARPEPPGGDWRFYVADSLIAAPLVESAFMFPMLWLLGKFSDDRRSLALLSALVWGLLHGIKYPAQGILVLWPFWIFSKAILQLRPKSKNRAYLVTVAIHSLFNLGMMSLEVLFWF